MEEKTFMNKKEWIKFVADTYDLKQVDVKAALDLVLDGLKEALCETDEVRFLGELTLKVKDVNERSYPNPKNRAETLVVPAHKKVTCKLGSAFQDIVS